MIWQLVKLEPVWKCIPVLAVINAAMWWFASSTFFVNSFAAGMFMMWIILPGLHGRYTLLEMTLPIAGKQLFVSRVALLLAFVWMPILAAVAVNFVGRGSRTWADCLPMFESGAVVTVCLTLVQTVRVRTMNPPAWLAIPVLGAGFFSLPLMAGRGSLPGSVALIVAVLGGCALASAALFLKAWAEIPKSFQLASTNLQGGQPVPVQLERAGNTRLTSPWWPVFRSTYFGNRQSRLWAFLLLLIVFQSLAFGWMFAAISVMYIPMSFAGYRTGLRWLIHLPISARKLLWMVWFPTAATIVLGLIANAAMNGLARSHEAAVTLGHARSSDRRSGADESGKMNVQVPAGYWRWTRGGSAPVIETPWGEGYRPETSGWWDFTLYNPYSVGRGSSQQYLEWQFLRATQAVYGQPISLSQIEELPRMKTKLRQPKAQIIIPAVALLYYLVQMCALHLFWWRRLQHIHLAFRIFLAGAPVLVAYVFAMMPFPNSGGGSFPIEALVLHLTRVLSDSLWMLALVALAAMAGLYRLAEKLWSENEFRQSELMARASTEAGV